MSIQVICPNGHLLTVADSCAGRMGLCPVCKAPVKVPLADTRTIAEDSVVGVLGEGDRDRSTPTGWGRSQGPSEEVGESVRSHENRCPLCSREVGDSVSRCPFCHSYLRV